MDRALGSELKGWRFDPSQRHFYFFMLWKYILSFFDYKISRLIAGRKNYETWKKNNYSLRKVKIENSQLAKEMELSCAEKDGFLTFSEYLQIDQFGENGFHSAHSEHGITTTHRHWANALTSLCKSKGYNYIVEFGPGGGDLAIETVKKAKKLDLNLLWSGIEINSNLVKKIKERFKKEKLERNLKEIVGSQKEIKLNKKCIFVFSYSLDSIPTEIFVNTSDQRSYPDGVIGIKVKDQILEEFVLNKAQIKKRSMALKNGIFKDSFGNKFDLKDWRLFKNQRLYLPVNSLSVFWEFVKRSPKESTFLVIDEFRGSIHPLETSHLCLPKDLYLYKKDCDNFEKCYRESGKNLFYYPVYFNTFLEFIKSFGFGLIKYDIEEKLAKEVSNKRWNETNNFHLTYAFILSQRRDFIPKQIKIYFPKLQVP